MKKKVTAYLHTHWDREWYREFEVFRLRLLRVFDNVLEMLDTDRIPSFYFDGQTAALLDYLEIRPEKEELVRRLIRAKKLYIGPFYCLVDEFLTDRTCFEKNLEIGLKTARDFGCTDFIGYFADTFGHSRNVPLILKDFGIDKAVVWRGAGDLPAEFVFNGVNTINLIRGYFMDIFSANLTIEEKAAWLKKNLDMIAEKSGSNLLLPIGADHLGIPTDISEQIDAVNSLLDGYEITLGSLFDCFKQAEFKTEWNNELRDNSKTFILPGAYSARTRLKQYNTRCSYLLNQADRLQKHYGAKYDSVIEYAYRLLLQNQAHDSICGCSADAVHRENITRYEKVLQIADTVIEELRLIYGFETPIMHSTKPLEGYDIIKTEQGFDNSLLYDTDRIPVTEDYTTIYTLKKSPKSSTELKPELKNGKIYVNNVEMRFVSREDKGDTYNFGAVKGCETAAVYGIDQNTIRTSFFDIDFEHGENLLNFRIAWENNRKNRLWQVVFVLPEPVDTTFSEDMNTLIERKFNPDYDLCENLPQTRGLEAKTNFAPMQRLVWAQGFGIVTKGLTEYEVFQNTLAITILRSTGIISNPANPCRTTPAGPPLEVPGAQQPGLNTAEFSTGFFDVKDYQHYIEEVYPPYIQQQ